MQFTCRQCKEIGVEKGSVELSFIFVRKVDFSIRKPYFLSPTGKHRIILLRDIDNHRCHSDTLDGNCDYYSGLGEDESGRHSQEVT